MVERHCSRKRRQVVFTHLRNSFESGGELNERGLAWELLSPDASHSWLTSANADQFGEAEKIFNAYLELLEKESGQPGFDS